MSDNPNNPESTEVQDRIRVFKATNKTKETAPDYWGIFNIGEQEYKVSLWNSISKTGTNYLNGKVELGDLVKPEATNKSVEAPDFIS